MKNVGSRFLNLSLVNPLGPKNHLKIAKKFISQKPFHRFWLNSYTRKVSYRTTYPHRFHPKQTYTTLSKWGTKTPPENAIFVIMACRTLGHGSKVVALVELHNIREQKTRLENRFGRGNCAKLLYKTLSASSAQTVRYTSNLIWPIR